MGAGSDLADRLCGNLLPLGPIRSRAIFGGWGLYLDDVMFGLIAAERLYLKVDRETEARYAAAGSAPFTYDRGAKKIAMSYREAPAGTLRDPSALLPWARLGLEAATRARTKRVRTK